MLLQVNTAHQPSSCQDDGVSTGENSQLMLRNWTHTKQITTMLSQFSELQPESPGLHMLQQGHAG